MYTVIIEINGESIYDYTTRKSEAVRIIARETGATQSSIRDEINARTGSKIFRDSDGFRALVYFN